MIRLDKFLSTVGAATRREAAAAAGRGEIAVDGVPVRRADVHIDPETQTVSLRGTVIPYRRCRYILLEKPAGVVSATESGNDPTVLDLLPPVMKKLGLFPCGRLDKNTTGLVLMTNDGPLAHRLLAPKSHVEKDYTFSTVHPLTEEDVKRLEDGVLLSPEGAEEKEPFRTKPCRIRMCSPTEGVITLTEGKYHQIKRMMEAVGTKIVSLRRIRFGPLTEDPALKDGEWRDLTDEEINALQRADT